MCYFGSWAKYRPGFGSMQISDIDPTLCTHLIFSFAGINLDGEIDSLSPETDFPNGNTRNHFLLLLTQTNFNQKNLILKRITMEITFYSTN